MSCGYALGDAVCLTGAVRDLHAAQPDTKIIVHPPFAELYDGIDYVEQSSKHWTGPDIRPAYPLTEHLVAASRRALDPTLTGPNHGHVIGPFPRQISHDYWVIVAGGVHGVETKWWPHWAALAKQFPHPLVQVGSANDWHVPLPNVTDLVGKTTIRQLAAVLAHASGLICPITSAMHLMRATGNQAPMIVLAGGREPPAVFRYANQTVLYHPDILCRNCWLNRCKLLPPAANATFAPCMSAITPEHVLSQL